MTSPIGTPSHESKATKSSNNSSNDSGVYGRVLAEKSSKVSPPRRGGLSSSNFDRIYPRIEFWKREEYYLTVGRVQNVVESYVLDIINREWYYDDTSEGVYEDQIKLMEDWEENIIATKLISELVRNWIVNGVNIISPKDWKFLQLQSIQAKKEDDYGVTTEYIQIFNGQEKDLPASDFIEIPFIELDRESWGIGMFDSLMNDEYIDIDGKAPRATLELYRQALQDNMKIHHKFASPRVIYTAEGASKEQIDNDITPVVEGMAPGDRAILNHAIEITQETVDGNARFIEHVNKIIDEVDSGLQSSANRLIAEPSAMADAKVATSNDDDRTLGIMEKVRIFMNREVITRVTGLKPGLVVFKWGAKDAFDLEFPEPLMNAIDKGILTSQKASIILEEQYHWKIPTDEDVIEKFGEPEPEKEPVEKPTEFPKEEPDKEPTKESVKVESHSDNSELDRKIKNEKLIALSSLNEKIRKV